MTAAEPAPPREFGELAQTQIGTAGDAVSQPPEGFVAANTRRSERSFPVSEFWALDGDEFARWTPALKDP